MELKVFSVRDLKAEAFLQPYFSPTRGAALRAFGDACAKQDSPFYTHPADFILFEIGTYNDEDGSLSPLSPVKMLSSASDFVSVPSVTKGIEPVAVATEVNHGS